MSIIMPKRNHARLAGLWQHFSDKKHYKHDIMTKKAVALHRATAFLTGFIQLHLPQNRYLLKIINEQISNPFETSQTMFRRGIDIFGI